MHYSLARNVRLNVWGQYFMGGNTPPPVYNPLFPHTGVGASISVDVKKNTVVSVGAGIPVRQEFKGMENGNVRPCIHWLLTHISSFIWFCYLFPISLTH